MAGIASIAPAIRRAVSRFAIPFVGAGAIALATAISLSPSATFAAEPVADCQVFKTQLPDFAAMQPPPVVFKRGGAGWSYGHRLADQLTDVPMTEETRESLGYASFVVGVAVNGGRDVQFFWSDGLNPKLCGFGRPLVLPIARVRELEGPHLPSPYANGDRGKLAEVPTPRFDQPDQALGGSRGDESDDGDGDVFPPEMMTLQERNSLAQIATGVVAYGESAEQCFYEAAVGPAIRAIDDRYQSQYGSFWPVLKRQSQGAANILGNMAKLYTPEAAVRNGRAGPQLNAAQSRCRAAGLAVPFALMAAQGVVGFQTELLDASDRLMSGKGRPR